MPVTAEALAIQAQLDAQVAAITDAQTRTMVAAWALAWSEVSADLEDTLADLLAAGGRVTYSTILRSIRLRRALIIIEDRLQTLAQSAGVLITSDLARIVADAGRVQDDLVTALLPNVADAVTLVDRTWAATDNDALDAIVERVQGQVTSLTDPLPEQTMDVVRRELVRGVAVGSNPRETARRMVRRAEEGFNGGLTRAMTIARTETLDAHREAARVGQDRHTDVLAGWVWLAHLGTRTCPACIARHGSLHALDVPGPEGHQNCRCSRMPQTKSWADLGFDIEEPPSPVADARAWFDGLTPDEQLALMGPRRLELLQSGDIDLADLATLHSTEGWRDSWRVTPVGRLDQLSRGRRARAS